MVCKHNFDQTQSPVGGKISFTWIQINIVFLSEQELYVLLILIACSISQAMFGMGLLVFGTPALLLFDYSFEEALWILVPASFTVSSLQFMEGTHVPIEFKRAFLIYTVPVTFLVLGAYLVFTTSIYMSGIIGFIMLIFSFIRVLPKKLEETVSKIVRRHVKKVMVLMGFIHGISNMGGAILSMLATTHFQQKAEIRGAVVFCYWFFGFIQLVSLILFSKSNFSMFLIYVLPVVSIIYFLIGRITFRYLNERLYQSLLTFFIFCFSILLIFKD